MKAIKLNPNAAPDASVKCSLVICMSPKYHGVNFKVLHRDLGALNSQEPASLCSAVLTAAQKLGSSIIAQKRLWAALPRRWHATFIAMTQGPINQPAVGPSVPPLLLLGKVLPSPYHLLLLLATYSSPEQDLLQQYPHLTELLLLKCQKGCAQVHRSHECVYVPARYCKWHRQRREITSLLFPVDVLEPHVYDCVTQKPVNWKTKSNRKHVRNTQTQSSPRGNSAFSFWHYFVAFPQKGKPQNWEETFCCRPGQYEWKTAFCLMASP